MPIVAVSMPESDLDELERLRTEGGFSNRSEVVRHALQSLLTEHRTLEGLKGPITAICTVQMAKSEKGKDMQCYRIQHNHNEIITAMLHAHSEGGGCIEVLVARGDADAVKNFVKILRSQKKVTRVEVFLVGE